MTAAPVVVVVVAVVLCIAAVEAVSTWRERRSSAALRTRIRTEEARGGLR